MRFEHVLVGLDLEYRGHDLTSGSKAAVEQAMWLAQFGGARVDFLHSVETDRFIEIGERGYVVRERELTPDARAALEAVVTRFADEGIPAQLCLRTEKPWLAITREVLEHGADLVILGKHDARETGPRLGSVSSKVLRKCPGTIWVVRPDATFPPEVVLAATDMTPVGARALDCAAGVAAKSQSALHALHAYAIPVAEWSDVVAGGDIEGLHQQVVAQMGDHVSAAELETEPELRVVCGAPYRAILDAAEALGADLVVMGTIARGGIPGLIVGNTAEKVLPRVAGSLLVVKPEDFVCPVEPSSAADKPQSV